MDNSKTSATSNNDNEPTTHKTSKGKSEVTIPLDTRQGGQTVALIKGDEMKTTNDPSNCDHDWILEDDEDFATSYVCSKPNCGLVQLLKKQM